MSPDPNIILYAVGSSHHRNGASFDFQIAAANIRIIPGPERPIRIRILCTVGSIQHKLESQLWFLFKLLGPIKIILGPDRLSRSKYYELLVTAYISLKPALIY